MARIVISNGTIHSDDDFNLTSGDDADTRSNFRICKNKESHTRLRSLSSYRIKSSSFTNTGNAEICGNLTVHGTCTTLNTTLTATTTETENNFVIQSTDSGSAAAPDLKLYRNSASPAAGDDVGHIKFSGNDSAGNETIYAGVFGCLQCATSTAECGMLVFEVVCNGTTIQPGRIEQNGIWSFKNYYISGSGSLRNYGNCLNLSTGGGAYDITFQPNSVEKMRLTTSGNVGIGTTAPGEKLTVWNSSISLGERQNSVTSYIGKGMDTDGGNFGGNSNWMAFASDASDDWIAFGTHKAGVSGGERIRIDSSGNVGIADTSPSSKLSVGGNIQLGTDAAEADVIMTRPATRQMQFISGPVQSNDYGINLIVGESDATDSTFIVHGNAGIGTSTNINPHGYNGSVLTVATETGNDIGSVNIGQANNDSDGSAIGDLIFSNLGTSDDEKRTAIIRGVVDGTTGNERGGKLVFYTKKDGQDAFHATTIDRDGILTVAGDLVVTNDIKISNGRGISFTDVEGDASGMTSELLDDYEEGTWNPTWGTSGTNFDAITYQGDTGARYTKIGQMVYTNGCIRVDSLTFGSASGNLLLGNLPFTSAARSDGDNADFIGTCFPTGNFDAGEYPHILYLGQSSTNAYMYYLNAVGSTWTLSKPEDLLASGGYNRIHFTLMYVAA